MRPRLGISVVEVIIALGMAAVFIAAIGNALGNVHRLDTATAQRTQALAYTQQALDIVTSLQDSLFSCSTPAACASGYSCTPLTGYTSCWTAYPDDPATPGQESGPFHLHYDAGTLTWQLLAGTAPIESDPNYTWEITIINSDPTTCFPSATPGHYCNVKTVTAEVGWAGNNVTLSTVLTGWKNIP